HMKKFIVINKEFKCINCGKNNPKLAGSCRNHCQKCLYSLHVDEKTPGDRKSGCKSLMEPVSAVKNGKKGWIIYHKCTKCNKIISNKSAKDDNFDEIIKLTQILYEFTGSKKTGKQSI
ncbi:RNHCP domain-containing protein, partial [Candidatus Peregrinibacteria bacterium]|nr:RNHCP domain-containing protein [Candidatus Peregrinibacteria bacterium]